MRIKRVLSMILAAIMVSTMLVGCTTNNSSKPQETVIKDHAGREVKVTGDYKKIVSGYYISTSLLLALGLTDNLVGIEAKPEVRPIYKLVKPELLNLPNVGTAKDFNLEGCIALKPDLVILPKRLTEQAKTLEGMGITVIVVNPESEELLKETVKMIGTATGKTEKANELISYYDNKYKELEKITSASSEKPKVYLSGSSDILSTASGKMYQNSLIEKAGGVNVAKDLQDNNWANISYEQLVAYNPDMIAIASGAKYKKEDIMKNPQLAKINAVKNGAVYEMPAKFEAWDSPVPSGVLGTMYLASIINEKAYSFDTFKEDASKFYKQFYNIDIDKELITK